MQQIYSQKGMRTGRHESEGIHADSESEKGTGLETRRHRKEEAQKNGDRQTDRHRQRKELKTYR